MWELRLCDDQAEWTYLLQCGWEPFGIYSLHGAVTMAFRRELEALEVEPEPAVRFHDGAPGHGAPAHVAYGRGLSGPAGSATCQAPSLCNGSSDYCPGIDECAARRMIAA